MPLANAEEITVFPEDSGRSPKMKIEYIGDPRMDSAARDYIVTLYSTS